MPTGPCVGGNDELSKPPRVWRFAKDPAHRVLRDFFLMYQRNTRGQLMAWARFEMTILVQRRV